MGRPPSGDSRPKTRGSSYAACIRKYLVDGLLGAFSAMQGKLTGSFPIELKTIIQDTDWYRELLFLRDELTHLATGTVSLSENTNSLQYFHSGIRKSNEPYILEDIFKWLDMMISKVNGFLGQVFGHLNNGLKDEPVFVMCGMVKGRALHRYVSPGQQLTFDSGNCGAWIWFEKPENPSCPFKSRCGAYLKKAPLSS